MKYAVPENGKVKNIVVSSEEVANANGWIAASDAKIGDIWTGSEFQSEEVKENVPDFVTKFQAKAQLLTDGLLDEFETIIADPTTSSLIKLAWIEAPDFERQSPAVIEVTGIAGLTSVQVDDLFRAAKKIKV